MNVEALVVDLSKVAWALVAAGLLPTLRPASGRSGARVRLMAGDLGWAAWCWVSAASIATVLHQLEPVDWPRLHVAGLVPLSFFSASNTLALVAVLVAAAIAPGLADGKPDPGLLPVLPDLGISVGGALVSVAAIWNAERGPLARQPQTFRLVGAGLFILLASLQPLIYAEKVQLLPETHASSIPVVSLLVRMS